MIPARTPLEKKRLTDQIIDHFVSLLTSGKLRRGDRLPPEHVLMKQFGVGRSSLREAIGALSLVGLLTVRPGRGTHVNMSADEFLAKPLRWGLSMIGRDRVHELIEARIALEQTIVGFAAKRATKEDLTEIRYWHNQLRSMRRPGRKGIQADLSFHAALAKASHNDVLRRFQAELRQPLRSWMEQKAALVRGYDLTISQHEAILKAVEARDVEGAEAAMRAHLESVGERLLAALLQREPRASDIRAGTGDTSTPDKQDVDVVLPSSTARPPEASRTVGS